MLTSFTAYAPELFALFRIKGQSQKLSVTAVFGAVKLIASFLRAILLIDHVGRKRSLLAGILVQQIAFIYVAIFLTVESFSADENSESTKGAAIGAIVFLYFVEIGWAMGWNSKQYVINAEIFPLRVRSTASSLLICFHYAKSVWYVKRYVLISPSAVVALCLFLGGSVDVAPR
jgi:hypothetical protein